MKKLAEGFLTGMILIDLQRDFGTIGHEIFLQRFEVIRFLKGTM